MNQHGPHKALPTALGVLVLAMALGGCFTTTDLTILQTQDGGGPAIGNSTATPGADAGSKASASTHVACTRGGTCLQLDPTNLDKLDLLFVVDDSASMHKAQLALQDQLPRMITTLITGMRGPSDPNPFPPIVDLHLGVVSSNMGLVGLQGIGGCSDVNGVTSMLPGFGDDGILRTVPTPHNAGTCQPTFPADQRFLSYVAGGPISANQVRSDFACLVATGTNGCGFVQPLEAGLKALWPSVDIDAETGKLITPNRITFVTDLGYPNRASLALGHGDLENHGFLRTGPSDGLSLLGVVVVSDHDDWSTRDTRIFTPDQYLSPSDPLYAEPLGLRAFYNTDKLYGVDRYVTALRALRASHEDLAFFATISGTPADLVNDSAYKPVSWHDAASRNAFYQHILTDPRMIERVDPTVRAITPDPTIPLVTDRLIPSVITPDGTAYPPTRMVQVAKAFGENGLVLPIYGAPLASSIDRIVDLVGRKTGAPCLRTPPRRMADGALACRVLWELPPAGMALATTPTQCSERAFLMPPDPAHKQLSDRGRVICIVTQLPVHDSQPPTAEGWYLDDFSAELEKRCGLNGWWVGYTPTAKPPTGVTAYIDCDPSARP